MTWRRVWWSPTPTLGIRAIARRRWKWIIPYTEIIYREYDGTCCWTYVMGHQPDCLTGRGSANRVQFCILKEER